jgi:hypothetical protein
MFSDLVLRSYQWCSPDTNAFIHSGRGVCMDEIDPDTMMIVAGLIISVLASIEIYSNWKNA